MIEVSGKEGCDWIIVEMGNRPIAIEYRVVDPVLGQTTMGTRPLLL
jgi:hypothetical protein